MAVIGSASNELQRVIDNQLADASEPPNFLFDFADCTRIDSTGIGALAGLYVSVTQEGSTIGITNLSNSLKNIFVMARLITQ